MTAKPLTPPPAIPPPVPDPTVITTERIEREILHVREVAELREKYTMQLREAEHALLAEKVVGITEQLSWVERLRVEQKADTAEAVRAALAAAKEAVAAQSSAFEQAVNKSEVAMTKQLEQISLTFKTEINNLHASISDLKKSRDTGIGKAAGWTAAVALVLALVAVVIRLS